MWYNVPISISDLFRTIKVIRVTQRPEATYAFRALFLFALNPLQGC